MMRMPGKLTPGVLACATLRAGLPAAAWAQADSVGGRGVAAPDAPARASGAPAFAGPEAVPRVHPLPSLREQAAIRQDWLRTRLDSVLPAVMRTHGVDMWVLSMREYAEDPVFASISAPTTFAARRRSIYVFSLLPDGTVERLALGGGTQGGVYEAFRSSRPAPTQATRELVGDEQWLLFRELVEARDPASIALNIDPVWAFSDGLHAGEREELEAALGPYAARVRRAPGLAIDYLATRIPAMTPVYRRLQETVHATLAEAFSNAVITPGETTTEDVVWWLRERIASIGMTTWFQPSVGVQRAGGEAGFESSDSVVIQRGDLLWTDFGVVALGLHTDTQHLGYVLRPGESALPAGLLRCLATSNRLQDIVVEEMRVGRTGNEVLASALSRMRDAGIDGTVYGHPVGDHGHGAGPLIGRWDGQEGVPVRGDVELRPSTWHSVELQATVPVPEWGGEEASCRQEEEVAIDAHGELEWVYRRQTRFHLVR
jgi:Xaa-Pro aminopeptidase